MRIAWLFEQWRRRKATGAMILATGVARGNGKAPDMAKSLMPAVFTVTPWEKPCLSVVASSPIGSIASIRSIGVNKSMLNAQSHQVQPFPDGTGGQADSAIQSAAANPVIDADHTVGFAARLDKIGHVHPGPLME